MRTSQAATGGAQESGRGCLPLERLESVDRELYVDDAFELHVELVPHVVETPLHVRLSPIELRLPTLTESTIVLAARTRFHHTGGMGCLKYAARQISSSTTGAATASVC